MELEEWIESDSAREEDIVKQAITLEQEMVMDDGRNMLSEYMRDYYQSCNGQKLQPVNEGSGDTQFVELDNPVGYGYNSHTFLPTNMRMKVVTTQHTVSIQGIIKLNSTNMVIEKK